MPRQEIKNTFSGGKMNKDLDERLIPNGEYRDAMNVQVTTSDSSDVGSLHNIMGNYQIPLDSNPTLFIPNSVSATCIGSIADEKNDKLYWMIEGLGVPSNQSHYKADAIAEYNYNTNTVVPVVVDIYEVQIDLGGIDVASMSATSDILSLTPGAATLGAQLRVGMVVKGYSIGGVEFTTSIIDITAGVITLDRNIYGFLVPFLVNRIVFTSERALNFAINPNTSKHYLITGINIIDKQLFWTDDNSEPKRIHIERYRDIGNLPNNSFIEHSHTPTRDFTQTQLAYVNTYPLVEEHITVIRQKPLVAPQLLMDNSTGEGITEGDIINDYNASGDAINSIGTYIEGDTSWIDFMLPSPDFQVGDILVLTTTTNPTNTLKEMRVKVIAIDNAAPTNSGIAFKVEILSSDPTVGITDVDWHAELDQGTPLFEFKFPRFTTRYKYEDGEYSAFGPFSEVAFLPDRPGGKDFEFLSSKGYNLGMTNQIRKLALKDFIPEKDLLPDDVIEIDILYKESNSTGIYSIISIKPNEVAWQTRVYYNGNRTNTSVYPYNFSGAKGYLPIETEMIYGILPENQLLRPWDNVPRKAKAQEVSGNRLIYGNYLQNYNLLDNFDNIITPSITIGTRHYDVSVHDEDLSPEQVYPTDSYMYSPSKSIKSLRTYQLGITYIDKYGRETPILTDNNEKRVSTYLNEWWSDKQVKLTGKVHSAPPEWARYQKFFIKETSSEYYNLALDRWYDAEDGNIWLSFPSSERNKVDIDTYLILKKEHHENASITEEAKYDILAIENEAPEFIKTISRNLGRADDDPSSPTNPNGLFGPNAGLGFPQKDNRFVKLRSTDFPTAKEVLIDNEQTKKDMFVRFGFGTFFTEWYEITNASEDTSATSEWHLELARYMGVDVDILTSDPSSAFANKNAPLKAEFAQRTVRNKPEFDGRFFVKIHEDAIIRNRIIKNNYDTETYGTLDTAQSQYVNASVAEFPSQNTNLHEAGPWHAWGIPDQTVGSYGNYGKYHAINYFDADVSLSYPTTAPHAGQPTGSGGIIDYGAEYWWNFIDESGQSNWFIDKNQPFMFDYDGQTGSASPSGSGLALGRNNVYDSPGNANNRSGVSGWLNRWSGVGNNRGIYQDHYIHLSYAGKKDASTTKFSINDWASNYVSELRFIDRLTTQGTLWRWGEDPDQTIYRTGQTSSNNEVGFTGNWACERSISGTMFTAFHGFGQALTGRTRWRIYAGTMNGFDALGSGPSGYLPTNDPDNDPYFDDFGNVITTYPLGHSSAGNPITTPAPGIRQDGMGNGLTDGFGNTIPSRKQWNGNATSQAIANDTDFTDPPGTCTWIILEAQVKGEDIKEVSRNPAIFETEPKESLDLEIYHEVGQTYPLEYNRKTNELYTPVGSVIKCWRHDSTSWVVNNPFWNGPLTSSPAQGGYNPTPIDPIPVGTINLGGGSSFWVPPIIVSQVGDDTVTLVDDVGSPFLNDTNWPNGHILPGDNLSFIRPDGSATEAIVIEATVPGGNTYRIQNNISNMTITLPWFNSYSFGNGVESNRIRDDYNQVTIDKGPKVSTVLSEPYKEERKLNGLIYSGIYNSTSGINNLNQFIQAEKITKDLNPTFGSIQKLFQKHINLIAFCEDKVVKVLSNKDALYNADGNTNLTATSRVLGDATPYSGEFGISKNPESFASENYRAYFTDKQRGAVLRLSKDGLTAISDHGMIDWFRDNLLLSDTLIGGFDIQKREYNLTLPDIVKTLSFKEDVKGWVSFKSFIPENSISLTGNYYTFDKGNIWRHHAAFNNVFQPINFNTFYNAHVPSHATIILTADPKFVKNYQTLNYTGTQPRVDQLVEYTNTRDLLVYTDLDYHNLEPNQLGWYVEDIHTDMQDGSVPEFIEKEGKWFNYIKGKEIPISSTGQVTPGITYDPNEFSWQGIGLSIASAAETVGGCLDPSALNYGCATILHPNSLVPCPGDLPLVDFDDLSCIYVASGPISGCMDPLACDYDSQATLDCTVSDGGTNPYSCCNYPGCRITGDPQPYTNYTPGQYDCLCNDTTSITYVQQLGHNTCCLPKVYGCLDNTAYNYDTIANAACSHPDGCTSVPYSNFYNTSSCIGPGTGLGQCCVEPLIGCTDSWAFNYNSLANIPCVSCCDYPTGGPGTP